MTTTPSNPYDSVLTRLGEAYHEAETANLRRYYDLGEIFTTFQNGLKTKRYGAATVDTLVEDIEATGWLDDITDIRRFLYWAKNLFDTFPKWLELEELARKGFTVRHAKLIFSLSDEFRTEVIQNHLCDANGEVIPSRGLKTLLERLHREKVGAELASAIIEIDTPDPKVVEARVVAEERPHAPVVDAVPEGDQMAVTLDGGPETATENAAPEVPATEPTGTNVTGAATREFTKAPTGVINSFDKALIKVVDKIPDIILAIKEAQKIGFDHAPTQRKYGEAVCAVENQNRTAIEGLTALAELLAEEAKLIRDTN